MKNTKDSNIISKAKNTNPLRVLYKKAGQIPTVKIIPNIFLLKKAIIKRHLDIIPYEGLYIICNNKQLMKCEQSNIVLSFRSIKGDLLVVDINKQKREFKSLSQEDIIWFTKDLINKSPIFPSSNTQISKYNINKSTSIFEREIDKDKNLTNYLEHFNSLYSKNINSKASFEKTLISVLTNLELVLASILKNNRNGDNING